MKQKLAEYAKGTKQSIDVFLSSGVKLCGTIMATDDKGFLLSRDGFVNAVGYDDCTLLLKDIKILEELSDE